MKKILLASIILGSLALTGCGSSTGKPEKKPIVVGVLPNEATPEAKDYREGLAAEISEALGGRKIDIRRTDSYEALIDATLAGQIQIAISSGNNYIVAKDDPMGGDNVEIIATYAPNGELDKAGYKGWIATKKGSDLEKEIKMAGIGDDLTPNGKEEIARLKYLKDKRFSFVSFSSTSGFAVPRSILYSVFGPAGEKLVVKKDDFADPSKIKFMELTTSPTGDHQGSANAIYNEAVDAGAFCEGNYLSQEGVDSKNGIDDYYILAQRIVPNEPIWVNKTALGEKETKKLQEHFNGLSYDNASENGKNIWSEFSLLKSKDDKFLNVDDSFYQILREL